MLFESQLNTNHEWEVLSIIYHLINKDFFTKCKTNLIIKLIFSSTYKQTTANPFFCLCRSFPSSIQWPVTSDHQLPTKKLEDGHRHGLSSPLSLQMCPVHWAAGVPGGQDNAPSWSS